MSALAWTAIVLGALLAIGAGIAIYVYARREEDPFITPRRNYDINQLVETFGPLLALI